MARRVSLPAADDLFRPTAEQSTSETTESSQERRTSGRVRHDEKMTVYVTASELLDIERARLNLRAGHGLAVDRGRLVREALSLVLAEFEEKGGDSALVQRLLSR